MIVGVAAANPGRHAIVIAGVAGLLAGALSMAAGEYVSVSSQADAERADLARETEELRSRPEAELAELTAIYVSRGVAADVAHTVAEQMMAADALGTHARDELGISEVTSARPLQAASTSAITFAIGAAAPLVAALLAPLTHVVPAVAIASLLYLGILGAVGARTGGARIGPAVLRVMFWGAVAMGVTATVGRLFGATTS